MKKWKKSSEVKLKVSTVLFYYTSKCFFSTRLLFSRAHYRHVVWLQFVCFTSVAFLKRGYKQVLGLSKWVIFKQNFLPFCTSLSKLSLHLSALLKEIHFHSVFFFIIENGFQSEKIHYLNYLIIVARRKIKVSTRPFPYRIAPKKHL